MTETQNVEKNQLRPFARRSDRAFSATQVKKIHD